MCGICGAIQLADIPGPPLSEATLTAMTDTMLHRGPNDHGIHLEDGVALGARRLSIVDVEGGHQPFANERGTVVAVQNGEVYNHLEARRALEQSGHRLHSRCDTEILPHLYEEIGDAVPERLSGMFAIAVWDRERRRALLARDRLGIKPLYFAEAGGFLVFGSEVKALLASGLVPLDIDLEAVDLFLSLGFVPGPATLLRHVRKLLPGHRLIVEPPRYRIERYWEYPAGDTDSTPRGEEEWSEELIALLDDSVRSRLMSDVPVGAMLSGGLDSTLVVALMARHMNRPVKTFSVGFSGVPDNELAAARTAAEALGAEHHELELPLDDPIDLDQLVWSLDEPLADLSAVGFAALSDLTSRHVTVALSGQGADELFAGYDRYRQTGVVERWVATPLALRQFVSAVARFGPARVRRGAAAAGASDPVVAAVIARSEWAEGGRLRAARGELRDVDNSPLERVLAERVSAPQENDVLTRSLQLDAQLGLVDDMLHYFDRTSMRHSLEVRVPFLDHRVVEFSAGIPPDLKLRNGTTKYLLRQAARGLVPDDVIDRPKVGFFSGAVASWFRTQVSGAVGEILLDPGARYIDFVDRQEVTRLIDGQGSYRRSKLLLSVLMLELWLTRYLPRASPANAAVAIT